MHMKYYRLQPDVPASTGENSEFDRNAAPTKTCYLHILFETNTFSDLMNLILDFFVTEKLARALSKSNLTGIDTSRKVDEIGKSENCKEHYPEFETPVCYFLDIKGIPGESDFYLDNFMELYVSHKALQFLKKFNLEGVDIYPAE